MDDDEEPVVTFPDEAATGTELELRAPLSVSATPNELFVHANNHSADTVKFEEKRMMSASKTKFIKDGFSSEQVRTIGRRGSIHAAFIGRALTDQAKTINRTQCISGNQQFERNEALTNR